MRELRREPRQPIDLQKTLSVKIKTKSGEQFHRYLRVLDLSQGGIRLSGDLPTPAEPFSLEFDASTMCKSGCSQLGDVQLKVETRWQKPLFGDMWVGGFSFLEMDESQAEAIRVILEQHSGNEPDRPRQQFTKLVNVGFIDSGRVLWHYPVITELNPRGIAFQSTEKLEFPGDGSCELALSFRSDNVVYRVRARLANRYELDTTCRYRFEFQNPPAQFMLAIRGCLKAA